jgi:hypothetical protein
MRAVGEAEGAASGRGADHACFVAADPPHSGQRPGVARRSYPQAGQRPAWRRDRSRLRRRARQAGSAAAAAATSHSGAYE